MSRFRTLWRSAIVTLSAFVLVGVTVAPAAADPVLLADLSNDQFTLILESNGNPSEINARVTNLTDQTQSIGLGATTHDAGTVEYMWQTSWTDIAQYFRHDLAPGEEFSQWIPVWSGVELFFYSDIDSPDPTLIGSYKLDGTFLPVVIDGTSDSLSLQIGYPVVMQPSLIRAGEDLSVEAQLGIDVAVADVRLATDTATLINDVGGDWQTGDTTLVGSIPVLGGVAAGQITLPADLAPGDYSLIVGDPISDWWPAGPAVFLTTADGNSSQTWTHFTVEPGAPRGLTTEGGVDITPIDQFGNTPVTFTFTTVSSAGTTSVTTSSTGPAPSNFAQLSGANAVYYNLSTTATFTGDVRVCITYDPAELTPEEQALVELYHYVGTDWVPLGATHPSSGVVCADTPSFSPFALGIPLAGFAWTTSTDEFDITVTGAWSDSGIYKVEVLNKTADVQQFGLGVDLRSQGQTNYLWEESWDVFRLFGRTEIAPGVTWQFDFLPGWSGMTYSFFHDLDATPTLIGQFVNPGRYLPFEATGNESNFLESLQVGWPVSIQPAVARPSERVAISAYLGAGWGQSTAEVWLAPINQTDEGSTLILGRGWPAVLASPGLAGIPNYYRLVGTIPVTDDTAFGSIELPSDLVVGDSYDVLVGDSGSLLWPAGPLVRIDPEFGAISISGVTIEAGDPRGTTTTSGVPVTPIDQFGAIPLSLTFDNITSPGVSTVTTSPSGPTPTIFAQLGGANSVFYDIETTASFDGDITVCVTYDPSTLTQEEQDQVALFHFVGAAWVPITSATPEPGVVCGITSSLSPFALGFPLQEFSLSSIPTIAGTKAVGATLTANRQSWDPVLVNADFSYQWSRDGAPIPNATATTYALAPEDAGTRITVTVTAAKAGYFSRSETSAQTGFITGGVWAQNTDPVLSGTPAVGQYLYADATLVWSPEPTTLRYQWFRASDGTTTGLSSSNRYTVRAADAGYAVYAIVTASKPGFPNTSAQTDSVEIEQVLSSATPNILGSPLAVGSVLSANTGTWGPEPVELTFQWFANGEALTGETGAQYVVDAALAGQLVTVAVTGSKNGYTTVTKTSPAKRILNEFAPPPTPTVSGVPAVGQLIAADAGQWEPSSATLRYQWYRNGEPIGGPRASSSYRVVAADAGQALTVQVTGSSANYNPATSPLSAAVAIELVLTTTTPSIVGTPRAVGTTLSAVADWGPGEVAYSYQWNRGGVPIEGAIASDYTLITADAGASITVTVTGSQAGYTSVTRTSGAKIIQLLLDEPPVPTVSGTPAAGQVLLADAGVWGPGVVSLGYRWFSDGVATGGNSAQYTLKASDAGKSITVTVTGSQVGFTPRSASSAPIVIESLLQTAAPVISGTPLAVGTVLTVSAGAWEPAPVELSYQWSRNGVPVEGATAASYQLGLDDAGTAVSVTVTGAKSGFTTAARTATKTIQSVFAAVPQPLIAGAPLVGQVLSAQPGTWDPVPTAYTYTWKRDGTTTVGTASTYTVKASDRGHTLTVTVSGTRSGFTKATSAPSEGLIVP